METLKNVSAIQKTTNSQNSSDLSNSRVHLLNNGVNPEGSRFKIIFEALTLAHGHRHLVFLDGEVAI